MSRGKSICKVLKEVRRKVADAALESRFHKGQARLRIDDDQCKGFAIKRYSIKIFP